MPWIRQQEGHEGDLQDLKKLTTTHLHIRREEDLYNKEGEGEDVPNET